MIMWGYTVQHLASGEEVVGSRRSLTAPELRALLAHFKNDASDEQEQVVRDLLATSANEHRWLKICFCGTCAPGGPFKLVPVCPQVVWRRPHFRRDDDAAKTGCKLVPERSTAQGPRAIKRSESAPLDLSLFLRGIEFTDTHRRDIVSHTERAAAGELLVARRHSKSLRTLLCALNRLSRHDEFLNPSDPSEALEVPWPQNRILHAASGIVDVHGAGLSLQEILLLPRWLPPTLPMLLHELASKVERAWRGRGEPIGYIMFEASAIVRQGTESHIHTDTALCKSAISLSHWIGVPARGDLEGEGPFVVVLKCCSSSDGGWYVAASYAHPILRRNVWMQVDARGERETVRALYWIREHLKKRGIRVRIFKPMFDRLVDDRGVRADFEIELTLPDGSVHLLLVETMGSRNPKYRRDKEAPHKRMSKVGHLVKDWRLRDMPPLDHWRADKELRNAIFAWVFALVGRTIG